VAEPSIPQTTESCKNCRFWLPENDLDGDCAKKPSGVTLAGHNAITIEWQLVPADYWRGEWQGVTDAS
jgi:hypothetical protein